MLEEKRKKVLIICIILVLLLTLIGLLMVNSKTYDITIDNGNSKYVEKVKRNSKLKKPNKPSKEGYEFIGWYKDGKLYDFELKVKENFTLKAKFEKEDEEVEKTFKEITTTATEITTTKKDDKTTTKKTTKNNSSSNVTNVQQTTTARTTQAPVTTKAPVTQATTASTTKAVTYSARRVPVAGSTIGQERIYVVNNSTGSYVDGTATITYQDGHSETVSIPSSGKMVVGSTITSVTNARGN